MVERQSAPFKKPWMVVVPSASAPNITARWLMDLSPGTVRVPPQTGFSGQCFHEFSFLLPDMYDVVSFFQYPCCFGTGFIII